ncbi:MAG: hypothetical protein R3E95_10960 [Thiolinea sp.]
MGGLPGGLQARLLLFVFSLLGLTSGQLLFGFSQPGELSAAAGPVGAALLLLPALAGLLALLLGSGVRGSCWLTACYQCTA